jgi:hypothetical protein
MVKGMSIVQLNYHHLLASSSFGQPDRPLLEALGCFEEMHLSNTVKPACPLI